MLAETVVQPALTDGLLAGDEAAQQRFDDADPRPRAGRRRRTGEDLEPGRQGAVRRPGRVWSVAPSPSTPRSARCSEDPRTVAEISDLDRAENALDRDIGNKLVEVYRPVWTDSGQEALFEIYTPYEQVSAANRAAVARVRRRDAEQPAALRRAARPAGVAPACRGPRRDQRQRELLLERAVDASDAERRRIAATLHDGPVQDLAATSFVIAGATANAESMGRHGLAEELRGVAGSVRASIRALRTLLVDIYPPSLAQAGLAVALPDLAQTVRAPGLNVVVEPVSDERARSAPRPGATRLPGGAGDPAQRGQARDPLHRPGLARAGRGPRRPRRGRRRPGLRSRGRRWPTPTHGHFGLRLLAELAATGGGTLQVASAPGQGTHWRLRVLAGDPAGPSYGPAYGNNDDQAGE